MKKSIIAIIIVVCIGIASGVSIYWISIIFSQRPQETNQAPIITSYSPLSNPSIIETESQEFNIAATDPDGDPLTYGWYLDGIKVGEDPTTYIFNNIGNQMGSYTVKVNVSDGELVVDHSWDLTVFRDPEILKVATTSNPVTMDPLNSWDSVSNNIIDQVGEPLIATDLTNASFPIIGRLAESWTWPTDRIIEFHLRPDVFFHDGQPFTGEDVIYTFERINYFGNSTGTLPNNSTMAFPHSLYKFGNGTALFDTVNSRAWWEANKASDPLTVRLYLNGPFAPAEGLLSYTASYIVGHESTPKYRMLQLGTDLLIGTGPFKLVNFIPNSEIRFHRWEGYWNTPAFWKEIRYVYYHDALAANNAMLVGDIDYLGQGIAALKQDFEADPDIKVTGDGVHDYINGSIYWYIAFNSPYINQTWRRAISYAFNYTYLIHEIDQDTTVRANSLVPPSFPAHNYSTTGANYDIPKARQIMQSMGFGYTAGTPWDRGFQVGDSFTPGTNEADWKAASFIPTTGGGNFTGNNWNFRISIGSTFLADLMQRFAEDMDLIGISVVPQVLTWSEFIQMRQLHPEKLHIYYVGWGPDYFESFVMINPLVNNNSDANFASINDPYLQDLLEQTIAETNTTARYLLYQQLQGYIIDVRCYHMPLQYDKLYFVHAASLKGFPYNCMRSLYWYPTYRV
ncbi:MAG: ABC transporter substrate-binding protein [Candidatus Odinarchaeota archaeon]